MLVVRKFGNSSKIPETSFFLNFKILFDFFWRILGNFFEDSQKNYPISWLEVLPNFRKYTEE